MCKTGTTILKRYIPVILLSVGIIFRFLFLYFHPEPFWFDQQEYVAFARNIVQHGLFAVTARMYGYPLLLAIAFLISGRSDPIIWQIMNMVFDIGVAVGLYSMAKYVFSNRKAALIVLFLYLFNPFTPPYIGLALTEIATIFFVTLLFVCIAAFLKTKNTRYIYGIACVLGFLPQVKPTFLFFSIAVLIAIFVYVHKRMDLSFSSGKTLVLSAFLFFLPFMYTIAGNYQYFKTFSIVSVDNVFVREFYISQFIDRGPLHATSITDFPPEVQTVYETYSTPANRQERQVIAQKYLSLAVTNIAKDPMKMIVHYIPKFGHIWEKHSLFCYIPETDNMWILGSIYYGNMLLLFIALTGFIFAFRRVVQMKQGSRIFYLCLIAFLVLYLSGIYVFSVSDERYSLPAYPFLYLFAGYAILSVSRKIRGRT